MDASEAAMPSGGAPESDFFTEWFFPAMGESETVWDYTAGRALPRLSDRPSSASLLQQLRHRHPEGLGETLENANGWIIAPGFQLVHVLPADLRLLSQRILAETSGLAESLDLHSDLSRRWAHGELYLTSCQDSFGGRTVPVAWRVAPPMVSQDELSRGVCLYHPDALPARIVCGGTIL
jgi:hypothetical protein